jgi:hypothetical protein
MKLFIAGRPGTGKTFTGNKLQSDFGWTHFDCELLHQAYDAEKFATFLKSPELFLPLSEKTVITWGFIPIYYPTVVKIVRQGFIPIWFEGSSENRKKLLTQREQDQSFVSKLIATPTEKTKKLFSPHIEIQAFNTTGEPIDNSLKLATTTLEMEGLNKWGTLLE